MQADGQTDMMMLIVAFCNFSKATQNILERHFSHLRNQFTGVSILRYTSASTFRLCILMTDLQYNRFLCRHLPTAVLSSKTLLHCGNKMKIGRHQVEPVFRVTKRGETKCRRIPALVLVPVFRRELSCRRRRWVM